MATSRSMKNHISKLILLLSLLLLNLSAPAWAGEPDWNTYSAMLKAHISSGEKDGIKLHLVDYPALAADQRWPGLLKQLSAFDLHALKSRDEKLAFWINVYNILAIKTVLDHWPLRSIRDVGGLFSPVWGQPAGVVAGKMRSLHEIEHEILRPMGEPRIHFAIVCASVSCPDLRAEAFTAPRLNRQLDDQVTTFLSRPQKGMALQDGSARLSKIFDWFEDDFAPRGGVLGFIHHYRPDIRINTRLASYLDYNWALNSKSGT